MLSRRAKRCDKVSLPAAKFLFFRARRAGNVRASSMACPRFNEFRPRLRNFNGCCLKIARASDSRPIHKWPFHGATAAEELHMHARGVWIFQNSARALPIASASCCRPSYRSGRKPGSGCGPVTCDAAFRRMVSLRSASNSAIPRRSRPKQSNWRDN